MERCVKKEKGQRVGSGGREEGQSPREKSNNQKRREKGVGPAG